MTKKIQPERIEQFLSQKKYGAVETSGGDGKIKVESTIGEEFVLELTPTKGWFEDGRSGAGNDVQVKEYLIHTDEETLEVEIDGTAIVQLSDVFKHMNGMEEFEEY